MVCCLGWEDLLEKEMAITMLMAVIVETGRSPGEGNGNALQYSCLGILMNRGAWWATVCGVTKSRTPLND